jgi:hypothetical protein
MGITRKVFGVLVGASLAAAATAFGPVAEASEGYYQIENFGSGKCAEVDRFGSPWANGASVVPRTCDPTVPEPTGPLSSSGRAPRAGAWPGTSTPVPTSGSISSSPMSGPLSRRAGRLAG